MASAAGASRLSEAQEAFAAFDTDRDGKITSTEFAKVVRALGHAPTEGELSALVKTVDRIYGGFLSFPNFSKVLASIVEPKMKHASEYEAPMKLAFEHFNALCRGGPKPGSSAAAATGGSVSVTDLRMLLTRHGDAIDDASFEVLIRAMGDSRMNDSVKTASLITKVVQSSA